jgi:murein DD-endopeptidase MepM/ murein hydrolase activator NlpD
MLLNGPAYPLVAYASLDDGEMTDGGDGTEPDDIGDNDTDDGNDQGQNVPLDDDEVEPEASSSSGGAQAKYQGQIDDINTKLKNLELEKAAIQKNINEAKTAKDKELANKSYLDKQISITEDEIALLLERIALLEQDIEEKEIEIDEKQSEYDENYAQFLIRLRNMQLNGETTQIGVILGADDFADYLATNEMMSRIADYDKNLMQKVKSERQDLENQKSDLESSKELVEADRAETVSKQDTLASQRQAAMIKIQDIDEMERQFKADLEKNKALSAEMESELNKIFKQIEWENNPYVGGEMTWPVPGYTMITSRYGWRWGNSDFHTGMDISGSGVYGKDIVAANAGKVAFVNTSYVANRGYGIYLIIDHGGRTSTLYGHCSKIVVKTGDVVQKGQKIAEVGSTGWSTGPHLHFEVRTNDGTTTKHVNPEPYLTGK